MRSIDTHLRISFLHPFHQLTLWGTTDRELPKNKNVRQSINSLRIGQVQRGRSGQERSKVWALAESVMSHCSRTQAEIVLAQSRAMPSFSGPRIDLSKVTVAIAKWWSEFNYHSRKTCRTICPEPRRAEATQHLQQAEIYCGVRYTRCRKPQRNTLR